MERSTEPVEEARGQRRHSFNVVGHGLFGEPCRDSHPCLGGRGLCASPQATFLSTPHKHGRQSLLDGTMRHKRPRPLRPVELVPTGNGDVDSGFADIDGMLTDGLGDIAEEEGVELMRDVG